MNLFLVSPRLPNHFPLYFHGITLIGNAYNYVQESIEGLFAQEPTRVLRTLDLLEQFGHELGVPSGSHMNDGLLDLCVGGKREL